MIKEGEFHGDQRPKLPVIGSSGTSAVSGNASIIMGTDFPIPAREIFISNDNDDDMTITVTCDGGQLGFILYAGDTIEERLPFFTRIDVIASGLWRWYVRGNLP